MLGPNGAGKSTLVKIMMTVVRPTRAEGTILGQRIGHKQRHSPESGICRRIIAFPAISQMVVQTIEFFRGDAHEGRSRTARISERENFARNGPHVRMGRDRKISTYSKGMLQRIGLAQALVNDPELVLLDEPTDGVDPVGRREVLDVLGRLREQGKTVFINSHALSELETICDRVAILAKGQVAMQGTLEDLTFALAQITKSKWIWPIRHRIDHRITSVIAATWQAVDALHASIPGLAAKYRGAIRCSVSWLHYVPFQTVADFKTISGSSFEDRPSTLARAISADIKGIVDALRTAAKVRSKESSTSEHQPEDLVYAAAYSRVHHRSRPRAIWQHTGR